MSRQIRAARQIRTARRRTLLLVTGLLVAACAHGEATAPAGSVARYADDAPTAVAATSSSKAQPGAGSVIGIVSRNVAPVASAVTSAPSTAPSSSPVPVRGSGPVLVQAALPDDPMGVTIHRLSNGFLVMLSVNREAPRLDAWITARTGSAKDPSEATGMAHYLEHMQFKGTDRLGTLNWEAEKSHLDRITKIYDELFSTNDPEKRKALYKEIDDENQLASKQAVPNELDSLYSALGFQGLNAFTSNDQTSYTVNLPSNRLAQWAEVETERLRRPVYRLFQSEIEAVYEEKNRGMDNAGRLMFETMGLAVYPQHPYGTQPTLGHVEHLKNPSITKMYEYFDRWYQPQNMVIALSGDFEPESALALLDRTLGALPTKDVPADPVHPLPRPQGVKRVEVKFREEEEVQIAFLTVGEGHRDQDALVMCDMMLANGKTGLIDVNLNLAQQVRSAGCSPQFMVDAGLQYFTGRAKPGQTIEEVEKLILGQVEQLKAGAFDDSDLRAVITDFEVQRKRELETNRARVTAMTDAFVSRTKWQDAVARIDRLRGVTKAQVVDAANRYFGPDYVVVTRRNADPDLPKIQKPGFTPVAIDASKRSPWYQEMVARPVSPIEPRFVEKGREVVEMPLRSGTLTYVANPLNDVFDLAFVFPVGTDHDPRLSTAFGLADLGGAGELDAKAFKRQLYALGATMTASAGREESVIAVSGLDSRLEECVDLMRRHFDAPKGAGQKELGTLVSRIMGARKAQKASVPAINGALGEFALRGADSGLLKMPTNDELKAYQAADLIAAAKDVWKFRREVRYTGRLPAEALAKLVDLPPFGGGIESLADAPPRKPVRHAIEKRNRVLFCNQKAAQAQINAFTTDGVYNRPEVPISRLYNEYMSGGMNSVVFQEIRESRSLAYSAGSSYRAANWKEDENLMTASLGTQADKTIDALTVLFEIVRKMPASPERIENARAAIDQTYRASRIDFRTLATAWAGWKRQGLDGDPRPYNWDRIKKASLADLEAFASRFKDAPFTVTVVGPKDAIDLEKLKAFGDVTEVTPDQLFNW